MKPASLPPTLENAHEKRLAELLGRMSVREKIAQLMGFWNSAPAKLIETGEFFSTAYYRRSFPDGVGSVGPSNIGIELDVRYRNAVQRYLVEETRLGIPAIFHDEGCHGLTKPGATSFPNPLGLACSWNPDLLQAIFDVVAREMRARGGQHALAPVIDVARDPRWGRIEETFGEDPHLNASLGAAAVVGLQGSTDGTVDRDHVLATLKHYVGHGTPEGGLNCSPSIAGVRELRGTHLAPFAHVLRTASPATVMPSYNEVDGIPVHASTWLLQDILRGELGFSGLIVSDYFGVMRLQTGHKVAATKEDAARLAFKAGVQLELPEPYAFHELERCLENGTIAIEAVDRAVSAVLAWKLRLGLFENPYIELEAASAAVRVQGRRDLALRAAEESIVLLKNDQGFLPLAIEQIATIAVIGPNSDVVRLGGYSGNPLNSVTLLEGIRTRVSGRAQVLHAPGCILVKNEPSTAYERSKSEDVILASDDENRLLIDEARQVAAQADVIILAVGETESLCREAYSDKVVGDATSLDLPGSQALLVREILAAGKPVVAYLMNGRPLVLGELGVAARAILEGWYMGQETGTAAARIIFGDVVPSGKLTVSFPKSVGHIPVYHAKRPYAGPFPYVFSDNEPLYPFGHGLSYTSFVYAHPKLRDSSITCDGATVASVDVTNTGNREADEIVQLYVGAAVDLVTRPVKELKGFRRMRLKAGETLTVSFPLGLEALGFWNADMVFRIEPGSYRITMGPSSKTGESVTLSVKA